MKPMLRYLALGALAVHVLPVGAQTFQSPGVGRMTAAYDPVGQAVVLADERPVLHVDPAVQQAAVYQPPGRSYGVQDPFSVSGPGAVAPWSGGVTVPPPGPAYGQPIYQPAPTYGAPVYGEPMSPGALAPNYAPCPPADPYACGPGYGAPVGVAAPVMGTVLRPAHAEIEGRAGDPAEVLQGNLMLPFWQRPDVFWFFDIRGQYDDERAGEGNFGVARRQRLANNQIFSIYSFYDIRHSAYNNNFQQGMVGFELLDLNWEYRVNGYLPFTGTQTTGANIASLDTGTNNIVVQQGLERAYFGFDAEFGWLVNRLGGTYDHEVRAFLGGYYFDTTKAGFSSIGGPRARLEGRLYDLPVLGAGSRFTYGASYQWDDVRQSQWIATVNLRIPFGRGQSAAAKLTPIERRMLSALRRDEAIITGGALGAKEQAVITSTGQVATNVTVVDNGATAVADVAAGSDIVVVTANVDIAATGPIVLQENQFVGGQFAVHGQGTGAQATFGSKRTVSGAGANDVLQLANNATITGLNVVGGANGIAGAGVNGFTVSNNTISGAATAAINLTGTNAGDITGNTLVGGLSTIDGLRAVELTGGSTVSGNTASGFTQEGFQVTTLTAGAVTGNTASGNGNDGFFFTNLNGGAVTGNTAHGNDDEGFDVVTVNGGVFSNNTSTGNMQTGFDFGSALNGVISGNRASGNGLGGTDDGFQISTLNGADVRFNLSEDNSEDGFQIASFLGGVFSNNTANNNTAQGYNVTGAGGTAADNVGSGNGSNNTHP